MSCALHRGLLGQLLIQTFLIQQKDLVGLGKVEVTSPNAIDPAAIQMRYIGTEELVLYL